MSKSNYDIKYSVTKSSLHKQDRSMIGQFGIEELLKESPFKKLGIDVNSSPSRQEKLKFLEQLLDKQQREGREKSIMN